jgi:hypothetical protein
MGNGQLFFIDFVRDFLLIVMALIVICITRLENAILQVQARFVKQRRH